MRNKRALITGGGRGIGAAVSRRLAAEGFDVYIHYHRSESGADQVVNDCLARGVTALKVKADLRSLDELERMFHALPGMPDVLVNNAGCEHHGLVADVTPETWRRVIDLNCRSAFFCSQKVLPHMIRNDGGRIINISSVWGMVGAANEVLYSMSKGALLSFTKALAKEVAPHRITVNAVTPGIIDTNMIDRFTEEEREAMALSVPLKRIGTPEEVAGTVAYLVSDAAAYVTGQAISPNGGLVI